MNAVEVCRVGILGFLLISGCAPLDRGVAERIEFESLQELLPSGYLFEGLQSGPEGLFVVSGCGTRLIAKWPHEYVFLLYSPDFGAVCDLLKVEVPREGGANCRIVAASDRGSFALVQTERIEQKMRIKIEHGEERYWVEVLPSKPAADVLIEALDIVDKRWFPRVEQLEGPGAEGGTPFEW